MTQDFNGIIGNHWIHLRQRKIFSRRFFFLSIGLGFALGAMSAMAADNSTETKSSENFSRLSIEELANIEISSVSKRPELLSDAAASVYVLTREDIRRSGATSIPEMLRLAPNLQVARADSSTYAITARGFNNTSANKLLVLIDGRTVYSALHSGVFWDAQDTLLVDIERIEVISGPGGTLWGSNAVNGVINIITRDTRDTTGTQMDIGGGTEKRSAAVRYGAKTAEDSSYRLYAKSFLRSDTSTVSGASAQDSWREQEAGFRMDSRRGEDTLQLEGSVYDGRIDQKINDDKTISGGHVLGRWNRGLGEESNLQIQAYFEQAKRVYPGIFGEVVDTYDIDAQHRFQLAGKHDVVWGGGYRLSRDSMNNTAVLAFLPARSNLSLINAFVQDSVALHDHVQMTVGAKLERNSYTGMEFQPNVKMAWKLHDHALLWSSIARAVRTPSRLDRDLFTPNVPPFLVAGGPEFKSEKLTAYEIGYRVQPMSQASLSVSTFYNVYQDLRTIELQPGGSPTKGPYEFENRMEGNTYGVEMWGKYYISDSWRLAAGYNYLKEDLRIKPGSSINNTVPSAGNDPPHQISMRSSMNLAHNVEFDVMLRSIGSLPSPRVQAYTALDMRLAWVLAKGVDVSLSGFNLTDRAHSEFGTVTNRSRLPRSFYLKILWNY
jgi:iron complex outermembrane receptor protein